jgi:hypothetical protein
VHSCNLLPIGWGTIRSGVGIPNAGIFLHLMSEGESFYSRFRIRGGWDSDKQAKELKRFFTRARQIISKA